MDKILKIRFLRKILQLYVSWEASWYFPECTFKKDDLVKLNWKAKVQFDEEFLNDFRTSNDNMVVEEVDEDNIVILKDGEMWSSYWLCLK